MNKRSATFRFSGNTRRKLAHIAKAWKVTKTRAIEMMIRKADKETVPE